ncbi:PIN domain-containing protein [Thermodesulfobacteriota bacterium]
MSSYLHILSVMNLLSGGSIILLLRGGAKEKKNREELAEFYSQILNDLRKKGKPIPTNDIWIAAVAFQLGLRLFSKDKHFKNVSGLVLVH